ncbi:hypothetical protein XENTR_v10024262 [Xenopus tropicalis]|nr:hypothetical protein XENTR_v10024262 [Xenopus tropicalis]
MLTSKAIIPVPTPERSTGFYSNLFLVPKRRDIPTCARSEDPEQIPPRAIIQNGIPPVSDSQRPTGRFFHGNRSQGRLPSHSHPPAPSKVPKIRIHRKTLPIPSTPLRPGHGASRLHEGNGGTSSLHATTRSLHTPLPGRSPAKGSVTLPSTRRDQQMRKHSRISRMADTPQKEYASPHTVDHIPRHPLRRYPTQGVSHSRKAEDPIGGSTTSQRLPGTDGKSVHAPPRPNDGHHRSSTIRSVSYAATTTRVPQTVVQATSRPKKPNIPVPSHKALATVVATTRQTTHRQDLLLHQLGRNNNRRQLIRLGRSIRPQNHTGKMVHTGRKTPHQPAGTSGGLPIRHPLDTPSARTSSQNPIPRPTSIRDRCNDHPMELQPGLHISTHTHDPSSTPQTATISDDGHSSHSILAAKGMVLRPPSVGNSTTMKASPETRPPTPRRVPPPWSGKPSTHGVAIEATIWTRKGFSTEVTSTLVKARKPVTKASYHRIWKTFLYKCSDTQRNSCECHIPTLLDFLQNGLGKGLGVNSLKVQVSALSILFQHQLAMHPDVRTFLQAATRIKPPYKDPLPPWDLNLVLRALQNPPFKPLATIDLKLLTWKVAFLMAISSARRVSELGALSHKPPYCIFHQDKVVLRTLPSFLPKVTSAFHLNQEIVLPSLCPKPSSPQERLLHNLDVVRALKFYIHRTRDIRNSDSLLVLYGPHRKGAKASKASIGRWINSLITITYSNKGMPTPLKTSAHTTRALSTSWARANTASAEQICKAATWSSIHTFTKFYKFNVFSSAEATFGRKVLQSAVQ